MSDSPSPKHDLERLLRLGAQAARAGNTGAAQALFRAIAREYPGELRAWLGLAGVATSQAEQRAALEQVLAIDPQHQQARRALDRIALPAPNPLLVRDGVTRVLPETFVAASSPAVAKQPVQLGEELLPEALAEPETEQIADRGRFPMLNAIALGIIGILLGALLVVVIRPLFNPAETGSGITPTVGQATAPPDAGEANLPGPATVGLPTLQPTIAAPPGLTAVLPTPTPAAAQSTPFAPTAVLPTATVGVIETSLPLGTVVDVDGWSATLLRPDYALILDGAVGDLQPSGRFVLALLAVSNNNAAPRRIPADLFVLADNSGRSYLPVANASTAYLALYGRGQRGDLALEDAIDPASGMRSVPILFDVPADAAGLSLTVRGAGPAGWPIGGPAPAVDTGP